MVHIVVPVSSVRNTAGGECAHDRPDEVAKTVHPLLLGEGQHPAADRRLHIQPLLHPAEEGVDGDAQGVGDGGEQGYVRRAALFPLAYRLGGDPYHLPQLFQGEPPLLAQCGDSFV